MHKIGKPKSFSALLYLHLTHNCINEKIIILMQGGPRSKNYFLPVGGSRPTLQPYITSSPLECLVRCKIEVNYLIS